MAARLEKRSGFSRYVGADPEAEAIKRDAEAGGIQVVVCGYGSIGKVRPPSLLYTAAHFFR